MVYPLTINDIIRMGEAEYSSQLNLLTLSQKDLEEIYSKKGLSIKNVDVFDNLMESCLGDGKFSLELERAFTTFLREKVNIFPELGYIFIGEVPENRIIKKENFEDFQNIIRIQNRVPFVEPPPENENAFQKKFRLRKEAVARAKAKKKNKDAAAATFHDLLSSICCMNVGVTPFNIGELSVYAFYELIQRYEEKETYETNLKMIAAGADPKKIKLEFWIRNLKIEK